MYCIAGDAKIRENYIRRGIFVRFIHSEVSVDTDKVRFALR